MKNFQNNFEQNEFELQPEYFGEIYQEFEYSNGTQGEVYSMEGTFSEASQMELASELLSVTNEAELDMFLGKLFKKAVGGVSKFMRSGTAKALGGMLKGIAKKALPIAGGALGTFVAPGLGTAIGGALGSAASNMFELELEGLSQEDREFETAKAYVRFAGNAARQAASANQSQRPGDAARSATTNAARKFAPGLLRRRGPTGGGYQMLAERILRLEDSVQRLSSQLQASGVGASGSGNSTLAPDQEYFEF